MKRISNVDTLSALFDRLITENIKLFFFEKDRLEDKANHQRTVIVELKERITALFEEVLTTGTYRFIGEKRTFDENAVTEQLQHLVQLVGQLEQLTDNDINIGESDRARLKEAQSPTPDTNAFVLNEKRLRKANEGRAGNKNKIDELMGKVFPEK